jgi:hypothetical protein
VLNLNQDIKDIEVSPAEYKRLLGFPGDFDLASSDQEILERMARAEQWFNDHGKAWTFSQLIEDFEITDDHVRVSGVKFVSPVLRAKLLEAKAHAVVLVAMSAGPEAEARAAQHWSDDEPDDYFFMEMYASGVVETLVTQVGAQLCGWAEQHQNKVLPHYSPGYVGWDIEDQGALYHLFHDGPEHLFSDRLTILSSGMLKPKKSLIGLFGITKRENVAIEANTLIPCEQCSFNNCAFRRKEYIIPTFTIEGLRVAPEVIDDTPDVVLPLTADAKYAYGNKPLKKWVKNHLNIEHKPDGGVDALFQFEGSTCSNAGVELKFDYKVHLSPAQDGFLIHEMQCAPTKGHDGHTFQCLYLSKGDKFTKEIAEYKPLLGQPLDDVLRWEPEMIPTGCLCGIESRNHKWKIVLQTLHYGLING